MTAIRSAVNALAATSAPGNRGGAASLALSTQFFGGARAPVVWLPLYEAAPQPGFAATGLAALGLLAGHHLMGAAGLLSRTSAMKKHHRTMSRATVSMAVTEAFTAAKPRARMPVS